MTHTPAPWKIYEDGTGDIFISGANDAHICDIGTPDEDGTAREDAALIAAAPEMLDALNLALEYWGHRLKRYKNRTPVWVKDARAAIAAATGKTAA